MLLQILNIDPFSQNIFLIVGHIQCYIRREAAGFIFDPFPFQIFGKLTISNEA